MALTTASAVLSFGDIHSEIREQDSRPRWTGNLSRWTAQRRLICIKPTPCGRCSIKQLIL